MCWLTFRALALRQSKMVKKKLFVILVFLVNDLNPGVSVVCLVTKCDRPGEGSFQKDCCWWLAFRLEVLEEIPRCQQLPALYKRLVHNLKRNPPTNFDMQTKDGSTVTVKQQATNHCNFQALTSNHLKTKLTNQNHDQTLHLTRLWRWQQLEISVTNNSILKTTLTRRSY